MSIASLEEIDLERLSADAREALSTIAPVMADNGNDAEDAAKRLGISKKDVNEAMTRLREEMVAQKQGATLPPLRDEDYEALKDSIQQFGQLVPILRYRGEIIDGVHRDRACKELGKIPIAIELLVELDDPRGAAIAANTARRQLTSDQRRKIVSSELLYDPNASDRSIAAIAGVSPTTVGKVRVALQKRGLVSRVDTRRRSDGREGAHPPIADDDPGQLLAAQVDENEAEVTFRIATDLIRAGWLSYDDWSEPFQLRLVELENGDTDLWARKL